MSDEPLHDTVRLHEDQVVVRYADGSDDPEEVIELDDVVRIVVERAPTEDDAERLRWSLEHHEHWTVQFDSSFSGASMVIGQLRRSLGFETPEDIGGPGSGGTVVWTREVDA